jgi:3',5'-cyclic AMP phosphodiesterase CpdA
MLICQITDLHIKAARRRAYGVVDTAAMLEACVAAIAALAPRPDVVVATGDLVDYGRDDEYALLRELLAPLRMPLYLLPGNHDGRDALRRAFPDHPWLRQHDEFVQYAIDEYPVRLVAIDTQVPGHGRGELCARRLDWLEHTLAARADAPTVVLMHHPPFRTGIAHMDLIGLAGADELARVIARHPQVERLLCGHLHRSIHARFGGTVASVCPSPAHQIALDLAPGARDDFVLEPPGYQLHQWDGLRLVTHTAVLGDWGPRHPFRHSGRLID